MQDRSSFVGVRGTNVQVTAASQKGTIIRAVSGLGTTNDLISLNPNPVGAAEGISIDGVILDEANTAGTTGRHCISAFGVSNSSIKNVWGYNCGGDGLHIESTQFHSYDFVLENVKFVAIGGQALQGTTGSAGFMITSGATITQIVGNGTTATITCAQLCPPNTTSITIAQNSQAGFNSTFTLTSSSGNSATFASGTNATGNGGFYTYVGLADIDRTTCTNCVYYAYNPGNTVTRFGNYGLHLLSATSAGSCTAANCGAISDTKFTGSFLQGVISNASNAGIQLEAVGTVTEVTQFYFQGEVEDSFNANAGSGLHVACGSQVNCSNIVIETAGFANYATQHNMSAGQGGTVWSFRADLNPQASPEFGSFQLKPQTVNSSTTQNPNCHFALKSPGAGTYCWQFATDGTWRYVRTDSGPSSLVIFDGLNTRTYPGTDNAYDWGGNGVNRWRWLGAYNINIGSSYNLNTTAFIINTAPTIAAAGCGGGAASIPTSNGTVAFKINVGTTPGSACTITMPAATTGWNCYATDITTNSTSVFLQKQTGAESTTSVTITNFSDVAVATAFVASDILKVSCHAD